MVQRACTELQQWALHYATSSYGGDHTSHIDVLLDRSSTNSFPPTTRWDDPTLTLHLSWVLSDVLVAIVRDLERKVLPFASRQHQGRLRLAGMVVDV